MVSATPESGSGRLVTQPAAAPQRSQVSGRTARPNRPFVVTLVALVPLGISFWYSSFLGWVGFLFGSELLMAKGAGLSVDVQSGPVALAAVSLVITILSLVAAGGLRRGARWARWATLVLTFFGLPIGFPADVAAAVVVAAILFWLPSARAFFGDRSPQ